MLKEYGNYEVVILENSGNKYYCHGVECSKTVVTNAP